MPKFLVINDPHTSDRPPIGRTESYVDDILRKLAECWDIARRTKCDFVVITGDIFHRFRGPQTADSLKVRLLEWFAQAPCPVYAIAGNHDLTMDGVASVWRMPFGVLIKGGAFTWLSKAQEVTIGKAEDSVLLIPRNWSREIDRLPHLFKLTKTEAAMLKEYQYAVMVAHASILPPGESAIYAHHDADKLPTALLDVLLCGHIHEDLGIHKLASGCWYANVGAVGRPDRAKHNLTRIPEVLTVDMNKGELEFERHPLTSARPGADVFFEKDTVTERDVGDFAEALGTALEMEETPIEELIARYTKGKPKAVVDRLLQYMMEDRNAKAR